MNNPIENLLPTQESSFEAPFDLRPFLHRGKQTRESEFITVRDIRPDLKQRIEAAHLKRQRAVAMIKEADAEETKLRKILDLESRRFGNPAPV